ncbi:MAG: efflux RND transporter periplasmic adaptor subunit [Treponema sp.]|nr:efflux RND transporter periplasmic adaptor subunit [Treponema sp.]
MSNLYKTLIWMVLIVLFSSSCEKKQEGPIDDNRPQVKVAAVTSREIYDEVKGFGSLSFIKKVDLASPSDAVMEKLLKREGDHVKEGDIVSILSNPQITLSVLRAESAFSHALAAMDLASARLTDGELATEARILQNEKTEAELMLAYKALDEQQRKQESEESLYAAGGISDESIRDSRFRTESAEAQIVLMEKDLEIRRIGLREIDLLAAGIDAPKDAQKLRQALIIFATAGLRAELKAAEASLESARQELESCKLLESSLIIRSPMTGIVGARYFEEGERIKREDKILTLMDTRSLYAVFSIPEAEALKLSKGMSASVSMDGTGGIYNGTVDLVYPQADIQSFTFLVRVILSADDENLLKPGMFARITISLDQSQIINLIPEHSLTDKKNNQGKVFTIWNNILSERLVNLGRVFGDEREIISGLSAGEVVVLLPDSSLQDGTYVSVVN